MVKVLVTLQIPESGYILPAGVEISGWVKDVTGARQAISTSPTYFLIVRFNVFWSYKSKKLYKYRKLHGKGPKIRLAMTE